MKLVELDSLLVDDLRGTIPNPHGTKNFIYMDYPRMDATFPRISVTQVSGSFSEIGIGESMGPGQKGRKASLDYDIDVWVKVTDTETMGTIQYTGTALRDKYSELIMDEMGVLRRSLKNTYEDILDIEVTGVNSNLLDEDNMLHRKTVTIKVSFIWEG